MPTIEPTPEQFSAFRNADANEPLLMLNLLRYKDEADYGENSQGDKPCSGKEAYQLYMKETSKFIKTVGAEVVLLTEARRSLIAPADENWDLMLVVRYPNRSAMLKMMVNPDYQAIARHRKAALADSRLIEMNPS